MTSASDGSNGAECQNALQAHDEVGLDTSCAEQEGSIVYERYPSIDARLVGTRVEEPWSQFVRRLSSPQRLPVEPALLHDTSQLAPFKSRLPLWRFVECGDAVPSRSARGRSPITAVTALVLDFDGNGSHDPLEMHGRFARFRHCGHTTFSNGIDGKLRFRVIAPLSAPIEASRYGAWVDRVLAHLGGGFDRTAREFTRAYYAPGVPTVLANKYEYWTQEGELIDPQAWPPSVDSVNSEAVLPPLRRHDAAIQGNLEVAHSDARAPRAKVLAALACVFAEDYDCWLRVGLALFRTGWADSLTVWLQWSQTTRTSNYSEEDARTKWAGFNDTHERKVTVGTIIHSARVNGFDSNGSVQHPAAAYWRARNAGSSVAEARNAAQHFNSTLVSTHGGPLTHGALECTFAWVEQWIGAGSSELPVWLQEMNTQWFQAPDGRDLFVWRWRLSELGYEVLQPMRHEAFLKLYAGENITVPGARGPVSKARAWLSDGRRRKYESIQFLPGQRHAENIYNLYRGFGIEPRHGDWSLMFDHVVMVICAGDRMLAAYLFKWLAWSVQHPDVQPEVAIVLRGRRGTGKGVFARWLLTVWGPHGIAVASPDKFTGRFNGHLRNKCFLFVDEGFWAGDKQAEGLLKQYITEPVITGERKNIDAEAVRNYLRIIISSNERWVIPSGVDERRFFALAVSDARAQDKQYFGQLEHQAYQADGIAAMLHDLLNLDIHGWHPRDVPMTQELARQKERSLPPTQGWYLERLRAGTLHEFDQGWDPKQPREQVLREVTRWARAANARAYVSQSTLEIGDELAEVCPSLGRGPNVKCSRNGRQVNAWRFPHLQTARYEFEVITGIMAFPTISGHFV